MLLDILAKILKKHLWQHLLIPLVVGLIFHAVVTHYTLGRTWAALLAELISFDGVVFISGVFIPYVFIMYYLIRKETSTRLAGTDLAVLESVLSKAKSYFATSTITMEEWFDPISQVFHSTIIKRQLQDPGFTAERILLFCKRKAIRELDSCFLEGYYAKRLAEIHIQLGTRLGFLSRSDIVAILATLSFDERKALGCFPRWTIFCPDKLLAKFRSGWISPRLRQLDFAVVEGNANLKTVLLVSKEGESVRVRSIEGDAASPYITLGEHVKKRVHKSGSGELAETYDFVKFFLPFSAQ
jgi:hypothetical protein